MDTIMIISRQTGSFIIKSLRDRLTEAGYDSVVAGTSVSDMGAVRETPAAILLFADEEFTEKQDSVVYLRDKVVEDGSPLFLLADGPISEKLLAVIDRAYVKGSFSHPIDVKEVAKVVSEYIKENGSRNRKKILVVDDSGAMLRNVKAWLEDKYQVVLANSGAMAIKYLSRDLPDLILLDYEMPIVDGKQVLEMIRAEMDFQSVPVIFLTSKNDKESVSSVLALKPEGYLLKTMKPAEIVEAVDNFFERRKHI